MKRLLPALLLMPPLATAQASYAAATDPNFGQLIQVVVLKSAHVDGGLKTIIIGNAFGMYELACDVKASGCITPEPGKDYFLFDKSTYWKMPGAATTITLEFFQDWTVTYKDAENIGLIPEKSGGPSELGMYMLEAWKAN